MKYTYTKPIEMPRGSHFGSDYWIAYSRKLNRTVSFFSMLEYANFLDLEMNPQVEYFCEQPLKIELPEEGASIFDMWVKFFDGSEEFQEIKYSKDLNDDSKRIKKQITLQKHWCELNKCNYVIRTEEQLLMPHRFNNLKRMQHIISRTDKELTSNISLLNYLQNNKTSTIKNIILDLEHKRINFEDICILYYLGYIDLNINTRPMDYSTEVYYEG